MATEIKQFARLEGKANMSKNNGYYVGKLEEIPSEKDSDVITVDGKFYIWEDD